MLKIKKILWLIPFALFFFAGGARAQCPTQTINLGMQVPNIGNTTTWGICLNGDLAQLDGLLGGTANLPIGTTTPAISQRSTWVTANTGLVSITNFTGGFIGQQITVLCGVSDTFTQIVSSANISISATWTCASSKAINFVLVGSVWTEKSRWGGTGTIGGSINTGQIAVGSALNSIAGSSALTFTGGEILNTVVNFATTPVAMAVHNTAGPSGNVIYMSEDDTGTGGFVVHTSSLACGNGLSSIAFLDNGTMNQAPCAGGGWDTDTSGNTCVPNAGEACFDGTGDLTTPGHFLLNGAIPYFDVKEIAAPANPAAGFERWYPNSTTHTFSCLTSAGGSCAPSGGGSFYQTVDSNATAQTQRPILNLISGSNATVACVDNAGATRTDCTVSASAAAGSRLDQITAATAANSINNADNAQVWNWSLTTASKSGFTIGENVASTATGTPFLLNIQTLSGSTANPLVVTARGTANGIQVDAATGLLHAIGTGAFGIGGTAHGVIISEGQTTAVNVTAVGGSNFPLIGQTGADPIWSTIAYPTSLTSGGVLYASTITAISSSALLTANAVMIGGGAGTAPSTIAADTTTTHALFATAGAPAFRALATGDMPATVVQTGQTNVYGAFLQNFAAGNIKLPAAASFVATVNNNIGIDSSTGAIHIWENAADSFNAAFASAPTGGKCVQTSGTVGIVAETGGACGNITIQTIGTNNAIQTTLNFITSTVNSVGLTITPSNATSTEKFEITGTTLPIGGGTGLSSPTAHSLLVTEGASNFNLVTSSSVNGIYVCAFNVIASAPVDPTCVLQGIPVNTPSTPYTMLFSDRATYQRLTGGSTFTITLPQVTGNTASNMPFVVQNGNSGLLTLIANAVDKIDNSATGGSSTIISTFAGFVYQDSSSAPGNWWTIKLPTFASFGSTCANPISWSTTTGFSCLSGTSGGIPYFSAANTWASSGVLTANAIVRGGGAGSSPTSGDVQDVTNVLNSASANTQSVTYAGGQDASANSVLGGVIVRGANETGAGGATSAGGGALVEGGTNAATNAASQGGSVELLPGASTGATQGLQGLLLSAMVYVKGATVTQWNLECESAAMTVTDCGATPNNWLGIAEVVATTTVQLGYDGQIPINASAAVTLGHTVCAGSTVGKVTDSGGTTTCTNAQGSTVGIVVAIAGTWTLPDGTSFTASTTLPLVHMNQAAVINTAGGGSGTVNNCSTTGGVAFYAATGTAVSCLASVVESTGTITLGVAGTTVGNLVFANATSGTITLAPATGALGAVTLTLPDVTATVVAAATSTTATQALFATATAGQPAFRAIATTDLPNIPLNQVVSPTGAIATFADGNNPLIFNCALTSGTTCLTTGETTAATTAGAVEHQITTLTTSTAIALQITQGAAGPANANAPNLITISAAAAGGAAGASNAGSIGAGISLLTGAGSAGGATTGNGGAGGGFTMTQGVGGAGGGTTTNNGGNGGGLNWTTGAGGNAAATGTSGNGGNVLFTLGIGGTTGTTPGSSGSFQITGTAPASSSGTTGISVGTLFSVSGVTGGADSNASGTAGVGSIISINSGNGGAGTGTNTVGGAGGAINLTAGNAGASLGTGANGNGGSIVLTPGTAGSGGSGTAGLAGVVAVSGSGAGFFYLSQGTAITTANTNIPASSIIFQAPAGVTAYAHTFPGSAATGIPHYTNTSSVITETISAINLASADVTGTLPINQVGSATSAIATLADGNNPLTINCALTSGASCVTLGETTASTSAGSTELQLTTLTTSTSIGLQITQGANGPANANAPNLINITAAAAGGLAGASNAGSNGAAISLLTGAGSAGGATTGIGGVGGAFTIVQGAGGNAGGTATNNGGNGGSTSFTTGAGGNGGTGAATAGSGGNFTITLGAPGTNSSTGTAGTVGQFNVTGNSPASTANAAGVAAGTIFNISGVTGGASSNAAGTAGTGSAIALTTGLGGAGTGTNAVGGEGGDFTFTTGNGGASLGTGANADAGDFIIILGKAGIGGSGAAGTEGQFSVSGVAIASSATSPSPSAGTIFNVAGVTGGANTTATGTGGIGSIVSISSGIGGAASGATAGTGGAGGAINLTTGAGGAGSGTGANAAGGNIVLTAGAAGTGGSGAAGAPGQIQMPFATVGGALTSPFLNITGTWNTTGVVDAAIFLNITNTASGSSSLLMDLQLASASEFKVEKTGLVTAANIIQSTVGTQTISGADYTNTTVTPSTVFSWTLPATAVAKNYRFTCDILWESTAATLVGPVFGVNISAAPTQLTAAASVQNTLAGADVNGYLSNTTTGSQTLVTGAAAGVTSTNYWAKIWGTIEGAPVAGSTFIINAASTSGTTASLNIRRGSGCYLN